MKYCDIISSESGPFLIADAMNAQSWRGVADGSTDYQRGCDAVETGPRAAIIDVAGHTVLLWNIGEPGVCDVFRDDSEGVMIVRAYVNDPDDAETAQRLAELPSTSAVSVDGIDVASGVLALLWSAESGECIESLDVDGFARPNGEMDFDESGLLLSVPNGRYICFLDDVRLGTEFAHRCHLVRVDA